MKTRLFVELAAVLFATATVNATSFCIEVKDTCCDNRSTTGTFQMGIMDNIQNWYVDYDAGSAYNKVTIVVSLDDVEIWNGQFCGCGDTSFVYGVANPHLIKVKVYCGQCAVLGSCVETLSVVHVYTPANQGCAFDCP